MQRANVESVNLQQARVRQEMDDEAGPAFEPGANVILCADDFAIAAGVSKGIEELALARRLSATGAIVTLGGWGEQASRLAGLRSFVATGLHLNLTLGPPLARSPGLASDGEFGDHLTLVRKCLTAAISTDEIAAEIDRQIARFEGACGFPPDFIDGHQHVHALPRVRRALIEVIGRRYRDHRPLIRDPEDKPAAILKRQAVPHKAFAINVLSRGFGQKIRAAGFPTNLGFSGVSAFDLDTPFENELASFFTIRGPRHLVMCHPGYPDAELAELDPVVERRHQELDALFAAHRLDEAIWHVSSRADRGPVDWEKALPV